MRHMPLMYNMRSPDLVRRPNRFIPFGFGFPLLGGFLGGLAAGALFRPPYAYYPPPFPPYPPYWYGGGFW